ncbi:glutathione S-transferase [Pleomorphomonas diazotrophica]|uniref:Glutathione S-transferase n=1 Tax=Pleomorphomonas diazotrophica TaxID=1166257 RepID=A0A1I4VF47_9HYPH|nr:glutathione S-transferase family protein [Pleomorphomonas diazotrophica]PKR90052.1 glutathione S-transferase [Pleomorphomonas diazotrophica]SFM99703.1 glutathione S-transferase [Pleomorphomonas diazotrophica]
MILYDYILSPDAYKVRLMAALTGLKLELWAVDMHPGREHQSEPLLALNPAGSIPILVDGDLILTESAAMLVYLAKLAAPEWLGENDAADAARIQQWLSFSRRLTDHLGGARATEMLVEPGDLPSLQRAGTVDLREVEAALAERRIVGQCFLAADRATIADIACFPYVALAPDGGLSLDPYPSIRLWMRAIRMLPGFIEMPGIHRLHELKPEPVSDMPETV